MFDVHRVAPGDLGVFTKGQQEIHLPVFQTAFLGFHVRGYIPGSSKKQPSHEVPHHRGHVPPGPNSMLSSECRGWRPSIKITISVDDARHFRSHTTLKLGVAGVSKVSLWFQVGGCFLAESGIIKDNRYV
jgi:hypothetical protein